MTSSSLFLAILVPLTLVSPRAPLAQTPAPAPAETPVTKSRTRDLGPLIAPLREKGALPGVVAAVVEDGELVALGASGVRMRGDPTPITTDDPMHLGSPTRAYPPQYAAQMPSCQRIVVAGLTQHAPGEVLAVSLQGPAQTLPAVPRAAVLEDSEGSFVMVADAQHGYRARRVSVAVRDADWVGIEHGLDTDEMVVVDGQYLLDAAATLEASFDNASER